MHGLFGYGARRDVVEIDTQIEPSIAAPRTRAFVPLPQTASQLLEISQAKGIKDQEIEVVGFLVPDELKDIDRKKERMTTLSQKSPTVDRPVRLALMTTGQFLHQEVFAKILQDESVQKGIKDRTIGIDVYMWNSKQKAADTAAITQALGYETDVNTTFNAESEYPVQIFYHPNTRIAVETSMLVGKRADIVVSALAERVGWALHVPFVGLNGGGNQKMRSNLLWANKQGLAVPLHLDQPFGDLLTSFFDNGKNNIRRHTENALKADEQSGTPGLSEGARNVRSRLLTR